MGVLEVKVGVLEVRVDLQGQRLDVQDSKIAKLEADTATHTHTEK